MSISLLPGINTDSKVLENFILSPNRDEFLNTLIPDSSLHKFFTMLNDTHKDGQNFSQKHASWFQEANTSQNHELKRYFAHIGALLSLDNPKLDDPAFKEIIQTIDKQFIRSNFTHPKPQSTSSTIQAQGQNQGHQSSPAQPPTSLPQSDLNLLTLKGYLTDLSNPSHPTSHFTSGIYKLEKS